MPDRFSKHQHLAAVLKGFLLAIAAKSLVTAASTHLAGAGNTAPRTRPGLAVKGAGCCSGAPIRVGRVIC
jgi:hypothetical protein